MTRLASALLACLLSATAAQAQDYRSHFSGDKAQAAIRAAKLDFHAKIVEECRQKVARLWKLHHPGVPATDEQAELFGDIYRALALQELSYEELGISYSMLVALVYGAPMV